MKGILGRKVGMTQVFTDHGQAIAVTVIETKPNIVTAVLTEDKNGYNALQLGVEDKKKPQHKKPELGHFAKAKTTPKKFVREFKGMEGYELGQTVDASIFVAGELVDVIGTSKGKGFAGAIKRHNQSIGPKSHGGGGGSQPQRQTGSLGDIAGNKVVKGMTMPGHMGAERTTMQNLEVVAVDTTDNFILVKGSIPGPRKSFVIVREAVKGLPSKEAVTLVNLRGTEVKEEKKVEAKVEAPKVEEVKATDDAKAKADAEAAKKLEEEKAAAEAKAKADADAAKKLEEAKAADDAKAKAAEAAKANEAKAKADAKAKAAAEAEAAKKLEEEKAAAEAEAAKKVKKPKKPSVPALKIAIFKEMMAEESGLSKANVGLAINSIVKAISETVKKDQSVALSGLGTFERVFKKARAGINPLTGEALQIAAKNSPKFKVAKDFKEVVANATKAKGGK